MFPHEKHRLSVQTRLFWCAIALVFPLASACAMAPSEMEQRGNLVSESPLVSESTLASNDVEPGPVCVLEPNCCGDLDCAPAPCPIFCL